MARSRTPFWPWYVVAMSALLSAHYQRGRARPATRPTVATSERPGAAEMSRQQLHHAITGLHTSHPELSAAPSGRRNRLGPRTLAVALMVVLAVVVAGHAVLVGVVALATGLYVLAVAYRLWLFRTGLTAPALLHVSDDEARALGREQLPRYTVLVPAYKEPEVIAGLVEAVNALDYPHDLLDVKILCEDDDSETIATVIAARPLPHIEVVRVPVAQPRTKPKALNYGLAAARGDLVTIYDAEDRPEPLQLRRAVAAFVRLGPDVACLQARLGHHNTGQNLLTRWFGTEYDLLFAQVMPAMASVGAPVPLGGTSNHIRRGALTEAGGWDPYNVTEDADLGIRLHRFGYRVAVLDSVTFEEANSDFVNWVKQRSRWYKGYWQTWLVHLRHPRRLVSELGWRGVVGFNLFVGGTPTIAVVNLVFWTMSLLWMTGHRAFIESLFPEPVYYPAMASWVFGNLAIVYTNVVAAVAAEAPELVPAALLSPLYWVMMSIAALKALVQLVRAPSLWEKTTHGLATPETAR